jgi:hypothetical protein
LAIHIYESQRLKLFFNLKIICKWHTLTPRNECLLPNIIRHISTCCTNSNRLWKINEVTTPFLRQSFFDFKPHLHLLCFRGKSSTTSVAPCPVMSELKH